jgi:hypothetical protein
VTAAAVVGSLHLLCQSLHRTMSSNRSCSEKTQRTTMKLNTSNQTYGLQE